MGFWSSFFGAGMAHAYNEAKKDRERSLKWNDLFSEMQAYETSFNDYLTSIGCKCLYICDVEYVNQGNIAPEKRIIDGYRKKIAEYLSLGGDGHLIFDLDSLDSYIEKLRYLHSIGSPGRYVEFVNDNIYTVKRKIQEEQKSEAIQKENLAMYMKELQQQQVTQIVGDDINQLSGIEFEQVCKQLVENMGFDAETTKASGDGGIDLIAYNHQPLLSGKYIIQCKRYSGSVGEPIIRDLYGVVTSERANKGILMTTGYFTSSATAFAEGKPIELIDGNKLNELLLQYDLIVDNNDEVTESGNEYHFELDTFMGYDYIEYAALSDSLQYDAGNIRTHCRIIELLYSAICLHILDGTSNTSDIQEAISLLDNHLFPLTLENNSSNPNKRIQYMYYMVMLISAHCSVWKGDFYSAIITYDMILSQWTELDEDNELFKVDLIYTLFSIFNLLDLTEKIDMYYSRYRTLIEDKIVFYREFNYPDKVEILTNRYNVCNSIIASLTTPIFGMENGESVIYDKGIDEWGCINIPYGHYQIGIDKEKDCLCSYVTDFSTKKERKTILVEHISEQLELQKNMVRCS